MFSVHPSLLQKLHQFKLPYSSDLNSSFLFLVLQKHPLRTLQLNVSDYFLLEYLQRPQT